MAGPWEKYAAPATEEAPWAKYQPETVAPPTATEPAKPQTTYRGSILPFTREGNQVRFDPQAGLLGGLMRAFTLPQEVVSGKVDPKSDEGIARAIEMAGVITPTSVATRAGAMAVPGASTIPQEVKAIPPVPTQAQLKAATNAGYDQMREMAVDYAPEGVARMLQGAGQELAKKGFSSETAPLTLGVVTKLANGPKPAPGDIVSIPLNGLDQARQQLGVIAGAGGADAKAAQTVKRFVDQFIEKPPEGAVLAGPAAAAGKVLADARSNAAAGYRSEEISGIGTRQQRRAAAANSGQNLDNSIRSRVASALDKIDEANGGGFSAQERAALDQIVMGTRTRNTLRDAGNTLGGGGGLGALAAGATVGAGAGQLLAGPGGAVVGAAAAPAAGRIAKVLANKLTEKELMRADELTRKRSSLYEKALADAPMVAGLDPEKRTALIRLLLMGRSPVGSYETGGSF